MRYPVLLRVIISQKGMNLLPDMQLIEIQSIQLNEVLGSVQSTGMF